MLVSQANAAPSVNAGRDQSLTLPNNVAALAGVVTDDGRPVGVLEVSWSQVSGPGVVTFGAATSAATTATFPGAGDYLLRLSASDTELSASDDVRVTVGVEPPPLLSVADASTLEGQDGTTAATVDLSLSKAWPQPVSVDFVTQDGTANAGCDYRPRYGTLTFAPGETHASVLVPVVGELLPEADETLRLRLGNVQGGTLARDEAIITIHNDDGPNQAPVAATAITPANGATGVALPPLLRWSSADPDPGDVLTHDVYLGTSFGMGGQSFVPLCLAGASPGPRSAAVHAYDESHDRLMVFGGLGSETDPDTLWVLTNASGAGGAPQWSSYPTSGGPAGIRDAASAYDAASNRLMVQGGCTGACESPQSDTWLLLNANGLGGAPAWTHVDVATVPGARLRHAGAYDAATNRFVIFGGSAASSGAELDDAWVLRNANGLGGAPEWLPLNPAGASPAPRQSLAAAYDPVAGRLLIFGGRRGDDEVFDDTWSLEHANGLGGPPEWALIATPSAPPARFGHSAAYEPVSRRMLVFGGTTAGVEADLNFVFADAWMLTEAGAPGPDWQRLTPSGIAPTPRFDATVVYAAGTNRLIVALGANNKLPAPPTDIHALVDAAGSLPVVSAGQSAQSFTPSGLTEGATYFWKIVTRDPKGAVSGSPLWLFTSNKPPLVHAGPDQTIGLSGSQVTASLTGSASDDGLPAGSALAFDWTLASGPAPVAFADATSSSTAVIFEAVGVYVLRLTVTDGALITSDDLEVTVVALATNQAPHVDAGVDTETTLPAGTVSLAGSATDDGLPAGSLSVQWSLVSGPGPVVFGDPALAATSATFVTAGSYVLRLSATDAELGASDDVNVTVRPQPDLVVESVDTSLLTYDPLSLAVSGTVSATVANVDLLPVSSSFTVAFFEDRNRSGAYEPGVDLLLGSVNQAGLGATGRATVSAPLSGTLLFAGNLVHAFVDSEGVVDERNESNNVRSSAPECKAAPSATPFALRLDRAWQETTNLPDYVHVMTVPVVVDLNRDGVPDVIFGSFKNSYTTDGVLRAVSGDDLHELFGATAAVNDPAYRINPAAGLAVGNLDDDPYPEIVAQHESGTRLVVFKHDGSVKWLSDVLPIDPGSFNAVFPALANLGHGSPDIVVGRVVIKSADGTVRWQGSKPDNALGKSLVADLDLDGSPEVLVGSTAYHASGGVYWSGTSGQTAAVANFDEDPYPEIVSISGFKVFLLNHDGSAVRPPVQFPSPVAGPPAVGNLDADSAPEIVVPTQNRLYALEPDLSIKWSSPIHLVHGLMQPVLFDFDADGAAEIVFQDEEKFRIYRGTDGTILYESDPPSASAQDGPVVADVDGDGHAEIVLGTHFVFAAGGSHDGYGLRIYEGLNDDWPGTRKVWNQYTYHVTNVGEDGSIPAHETNSWETVNSYRQANALEACAFAKPDLTPSLLRVTTTGSSRSLTVRIGNGGAAAAPGGVPVSFYEGDPRRSGSRLGMVRTSSASFLVPGSFEDVTLTLPLSLTTSEPVFVAADDLGDLKGIVAETNEDNNILGSTIALVATGGLPDLYPTRVDVAAVTEDAQTLTVGGTAAVEVQNQGEGAPTGPFTVTFFEDRNRNAQLDPGVDLVLGTATHPGLAAGAQARVQVAVSGLVSFRGSAIHAFVDSGAAVAETDEANNVARSSRDCLSPSSSPTWAPRIKWRWTGSTILPLSNNVATTPVVADLNGDGFADVIFTTFATSTSSDGHLRAVSGKDGSELFTVTNPLYDLKPFTQLAVGNIDEKDPADSAEIAAQKEHLEIVAIDETFRVIAFDDHATFRWRGPATATADSVALARVPDPGGTTKGVVLAGSAVLNGKDGSLRHLFPKTVTGRYWGDLPLAVDLDGDGVPEYLNCASAYREDGSLVFQNTQISQGADCAAAIANFDDDPDLEIAVLSPQGVVYLLERDGTIVGQTASFIGGLGDGLVVADFDGDGRPDVGVAGVSEYTVVSALGRITWQAPRGTSTGASPAYGGSSAFDFDGDGSAEIVYADRQHLRIFRGRDGAVFYEGPFGTCNGKEYPVVADIDGDGRAEIVGSLNNSCNGGQQRGIYILEDANDNWVGARPVFNQHTYHVTNVSDDGQIPLPERPSHFEVNSYRETRVLGRSRFATSDLTASFVRRGESGSSLTLTARLGNGGELPVSPGIAVSFYNAPPGAGTLLGTVRSSELLEPGAFEDVVLVLPGDTASTSNVWAAADDTGTGNGEVRECDEANNVVDSGLRLNQAPSVDAGADRTIALPDAVIGLEGSATDDGLPVASTLTTMWSAVSGPAAVVFSDPSDLHSTATFVAAGTYVLRLKATDGSLSGTDDVTVVVRPENQPPQVQAGADQAITRPPTSTVTLAGIVTDDGLPLSGSLTVSWSQLSGPAPVAVANPASASTTATFTAAGVYMLRLSASDSALSAFDDVVVTVTAGNLAPVVDAGADQSITLPVRSVSLFGTAIDDGLPAGGSLQTTWSVVSGPGNVVYSAPQNSASTADFDAVGVYVLRLTASDSALSTSDTLTVTVLPGTATGNPPTVAIESPEERAGVVTPTDVVGTVQSASLFLWKVEFRRAGTVAYARIATGTTPVTSGVLATLDPTLLRNGVYELRLTATDTANRSAKTSRFVVVKENQKVGHFTVSFVDLEVPVAGLPIRLTRTYDSRDKAKGDFGFGSRLDLSALEVDENGTAGLSWYGTSSGGAFPTYCLQPTKPLVVTVTLPDGRVQEFEPVVTPSCQPFVPIDHATMSFKPLAGTATLGTLAPVDGGEVEVLANWPSGPAQFFSSINYQLYDPSVYRYTSPDGRSFVVEQGKGLKSLTDLNLNTLTVTPNGVTHSSGRGVVFVRDAEGRITTITDPSGNAMTYSYDAAGDLQTYTDREQNATTFTYEPAFPHHLKDIEDPLGRTPIRNDYYPDGRLKSHTDAFGKTIEYVHSLTARQEQVTDRNGNVRLLEYDIRGNVEQETDPSGKVIVRTFDPRNNRLSETAAYDPANPPSPIPTTSFTYDTQDNLLSSTDPEGNKTEYTYNTKKQVLTTKDARGQITSSVYDTKGNLTSTTDALGNVTGYAYDSKGNVLSQTVTVVGVAQTTSYAYDGFGNLTQETDALGHTTTYTYDANGNRKSQGTTRTTTAGVETLTTSHDYDKQGRLTKTTDPDGGFSRTVYDALGRQVETHDKLDRKISYTYDEMGRLITTTYPDLTFDASTYDAEGRRLSSTDRGNHTTGYDYDNLGRLKKTTYPDTSFTENTYDAAGRLVATKDARGKTTTYTYDTAGRRTKVKDPLGNETVFTYDKNGNQKTVTDPKNQTTTFEYDSLNRRTKTIFPDTSFTLTGYDSLGRRTSETDQAGKTTSFTYDALGRLTKVTDALNQDTVYAYDELGNRTSQTDARGKQTRFEYDKLGRQTKRILPDGKSESMTYDAAGSLTTRTDFMGRVTTYGYDDNRRLTSRSYPNPAESVSFTYSITGRRLTATDNRGTTTYSYDLRDRLTSLVQPGLGSLAYTYDGNGNRLTLSATTGSDTHTTRYTYDDAGRLDVVTDLLGRTYDYGYDANGNRASLLYPNGTDTDYTYNTLNRLTNLATTGPLGPIHSQALTLGPVGNRTQITEQDGSVKTYTYDALYRLTGETVSGLFTYSKTFTYDQAGNRQQQVTTGTGAPGTPLALGTISYGYDDRDRLTTEGSQAYSWDDNGNLITKDAEATYVWDHETRLTKVTKTDGTVVEHLSDADGNRVQTKTTKPGQQTATTNYLVDTSASLSQVVAEIDDSGNMTAYYVRGDELLAVMRPLLPAPAVAADWQTRFFHSDSIGSIRRLTNEAGNITDGYTYSAFGELLGHSGLDPQPYSFAGEPLDPNSGFQYHRARWMDPRVGRFVGMDPWPGRPYDPRSLHKYLYAGADPLNTIDPTGRFFSSADVVSALSSLQTLAAVALPQVAAFLEALAPFYFASLKVVFWADVGLTVLGATATVAGAVLDSMASRLEATNTAYPPGNGPRGIEIGRVAGQNLADTFPIIDDFDFDQGVATSIKSTTQVRSQAQLVRVIAGYAGQLDTIDRDLRGFDNAGRSVVIPMNAIKVRQLLIAVPMLEPGVARGLSGQLAQVARVMGVNIRLVQVRGLKP